MQKQNRTLPARTEPNQPHIFNTAKEKTVVKPQATRAPDNTFPINKNLLAPAVKAHVHLGGAIRLGTINFFNAVRGYGLIRDNITMESYFTHRGCSKDFIGNNDAVTFEIENLGGLMAINVCKIHTGTKSL